MSDKLSEIRKRAWDTRRETYGPKGHARSYSCGTAQTNGCALCPARAMIVRLHVEGTLSEGQAAKATGLDRVALRTLADDYKDTTP